MTPAPLAAAPAVAPFVAPYTPAPPAQATRGPTLPVGKCVNLSDALEAPQEGAWAPPVAEDDLRIIRSAGFATVRIPVSWSAHAQQAAPYAIEPAFLERVHHVVDLASAAGLNVILDLHHDDPLMRDPVGQGPRFAALWEQIGASFTDAPSNVWFELLNEPHANITAAELWPLLGPALAAVRRSNPRRPVLIGAADWSSLTALATTLQLPDDPYLVPTFHYYEPFEFTHQGAAWVEHPPPLGRRFGSAADLARLGGDLATLRDYMRRTGRTPVLGEYGAQDDPAVPLDQRLLYYRTISAAFASVGVQSCAWGYRHGFRLRVGDHWLPGALDALVATTAVSATTRPGGTR
jgi:endoglucanase